jgi:L-amino acid N-acyltransferase YncA
MPQESRFEIVIAPLQAGDYDAVRAIYLEGIATGNATFEKSAPEWDKWDRDHLPSCRLVARSQGETLGWAALSPVSDRCVYAGVAEASAYVAARARGQGVGLKLLSALIEASERQGLWTLQAGVFPENTVSLALCRRAGFRIVGTRERLGSMHGLWRDVLLLERRSPAVGL